MRQKRVQQWAEAVLITVERHRKNGKLQFGESRINRRDCLAEYRRVYKFELPVSDTEPYQKRIRELLEGGEVVLKVVG